VETFLSPLMVTHWNEYLESGKLRTKPSKSQRRGELDWCEMIFPSFRAAAKLRIKKVRGSREAKRLGKQIVFLEGLVAAIVAQKERRSPTRRGRLQQRANGRKGAK
jgi:hypothetical protein